MQTYLTRLGIGGLEQFKLCGILCRRFPKSSNAPRLRSHFLATEYGELLRWCNRTDQLLRVAQKVQGNRIYTTLVLKSGQKPMKKQLGAYICTAFHGWPPSETHQADHIDRNPLNNRPGNLRWSTPKENCRNRDMTRCSCPVTLVKDGVVEQFSSQAAAIRFLGVYRGKVLQQGETVKGWYVLEKGVQQNQQSKNSWSCPRCGVLNDFSAQVEVFYNNNSPLPPVFLCQTATCQVAFQR